MSVTTKRLVGAALGLSAFVAVLLAAFTWPASELEPREVPVVVAGPVEAAAQVENRLAATAEGGFELETVADRDAAVARIEDREAYGAIVLGPQGPAEVLTAGAASPAIAQQLTRLAAELDAPATDVVPTAEADPRGLTFNSGALPLVLAGLITGVVASVAIPTGRQRVTLVAGVAVLGGFALAGVLQAWLDALGGSYWANSGVIALGLAALALTVVGLRQALGMAGIGVAALLIMLVGNPLSGITSAPELLPLGWLGQLLPPGATGTALRSTAFFDGAGVGVPLLVLAGWTVAGLALALLPERGTGSVDTPEPVKEAQAA